MALNSLGALMQASHNADLREALSRTRAAMEAFRVIGLARRDASAPRLSRVSSRRSRG